MTRLAFLTFPVEFETEGQSVGGGSSLCKVRSPLPRQPDQCVCRDSGGNSLSVWAAVLMEVLSGGRKRGMWWESSAVVQTQA